MIHITPVYMNLSNIHLVLFFVLLGADAADVSNNTLTVPTDGKDDTTRKGYRIVVGVIGPFSSFHHRVTPYGPQPTDHTAHDKRCRDGAIISRIAGIPRIVTFHPDMTILWNNIGIIKNSTTKRSTRLEYLLIYKKNQ